MFGKQFTAVYSTDRENEQVKYEILICTSLEK